MQNEENQVLGMPDIGMPVESEGTTVEKPKDKPKDKEKEKDVIDQMLFSPSSTNADSTITLEKTSDESEAEERERKDFENKRSKDLLKILESDDDSELSEKYQKELLEKALKDPSSVEVNTPRGWMTVRDAIDQGFSLADNDFTREPIPPVDWEGEISKLDPREQETIRRLTQRGTPQVGPNPGNEIPAEGYTGESSLEEAGINPRPDMMAPEEPVSEGGMSAGAAPEIPLGV